MRMSLYRYIAILPHCQSHFSYGNYWTSVDRGQLNRVRTPLASCSQKTYWTGAY